MAKIAAETGSNNYNDTDFTWDSDTAKGPYVDRPRTLFFGNVEPETLGDIIDTYDLDYDTKGRDLEEPHVRVRMFDEDTEYPGYAQIDIRREYIKFPLSMLKLDFIESRYGESSSDTMLLEAETTWDEVNSTLKNLGLDTNESFI